LIDEGGTTTDFTIVLNVSKGEEEEEEEEKNATSVLFNPFGNTDSTFSFQGMEQVMNELQSTPFSFDTTPTTNTTTTTTTTTATTSNPFSFGSNSQQAKDETSGLRCQIEGDSYKWKVHVDVLKQYIPAFFNSTAQLMGVADSLTINADDMEWDIAPRNVKQVLYHFVTLIQFINHS
jgi:hypothetical protein